MSNFAFKCSNFINIALNQGLKSAAFFVEIGNSQIIVLNKLGKGLLGLIQQIVNKYLDALDSYFVKIVATFKLNECLKNRAHCVSFLSSNEELEHFISMGSQLRERLESLEVFF